MASPINKIAKPKGFPQEMNDTEQQIAQALFDLESNFELGSGKKAIAIYVPVPLLKQFHKVQQRLTRELEKKFSDRHIVFIAHRRILRKPGRKSRVKQPRPRSRTLTSVHEKILEDLVYPTEIVGKRTRVKVDGTKILKVYAVFCFHAY
ncbi:5442_t:CDS:2 [Ambispora gerdemannii]|uniref:40S ribosomal protein S7 n=1 Tax=Ambispora gerdemannii TaxID=144530 RepID=A0A9N8ZHL4_9GLOM|nr:5442_t:CDS:2 [Ambispora gerdemannii]